MPDDEYIGVLLAVCSSVAIGSSYVTTKIGLRDASQRHGFRGDGYEYFRNPIWWAGMSMLVLGEIFNFAAYAFAPAVLVTPLGALSVLTGTILGAYFLKERLNTLGKLGCALCLVGSVLIVANAPPDKEVETVNEILHFAVQPGFLFFCFVTTVFSIVMIYFVCPRYGTTNPIYYLSVCAATGAVSVMALKAFGIAIKLTFAGVNQFVHLSTYIFAVVAIGCILVQMNYFNKALNTFSQSIVSPIYYVIFTTAVLTASFVLFQGFNMKTNNIVGTMSLLCGFLIIFSGVYLLNYPDGNPHADGYKSPGGERLEVDDDYEAVVADDTAAAEDVVRTRQQRLPLQDLDLLSPRFSDETETQGGDRTRTKLMQSYDDGVRSNNGGGYILRELSRDGEEGVDEND